MQQQDDMTGRILRTSTVTIYFVFLLCGAVFGQFGSGGYRPYGPPGYRPHRPPPGGYGHPGAGYGPGVWNDPMCLGVKPAGGGYCIRSDPVTRLFCCKGDPIHLQRGYNFNDFGCCGNRLVRKRDCLCCSNDPRPKGFSPRRPMYCCEKKRFDPISQICCDGNVRPKFGRNTRCCHKHPYNPLSSVCCGQDIKLKFQAKYDLSCDPSNYAPSLLYPGAPDPNAQQHHSHGHMPLHGPKATLLKDPTSHMAPPHSHGGAGSRPSHMNGPPPPPPHSHGGAGHQPSHLTGPQPPPHSHGGAGHQPSHLTGPPPPPHSHGGAGHQPSHLTGPQPPPHSHGPNGETVPQPSPSNGPPPPNSQGPNGGMGPPPNHFRGPPPPGPQPHGGFNGAASPQPNNFNGPPRAPGGRFGTTNHPQASLGQPQGGANPPRQPPINMKAFLQRFLMNMRQMQPPPPPGR